MYHIKKKKSDETIKFHVEHVHFSILYNMTVEDVEILKLILCLWCIIFV